MTSESANNPEKLEGSLIDIVIEGWRFARVFTRLINKVDAGESARYINQVRYFQKKLEENLEAGVLSL
jgi:hypothetical protein